MPIPILIVEDDVALVRIISRNLSIRGYATEVAPTVVEALRTVESGCPSLLLLDIDLPDGSGWEVLRVMRAGRCASVPVIVVSALRPNMGLVQELRCAAVVEKPFPIESLLRLIRAHVREPAQSPEAGTVKEVTG